MNNVKKIVAMIMAGFVMLAFAGCGKKTEEKSKAPSSEKKYESKDSGSSKSSVASTVTWVKKTDAYEKTITVNFDENELIIDGKVVTVYVKENDALNEYKYVEEALQGGSILDAKLENKTITQIFDINSDTLSGVSFSKTSRNKTNYKRYVENLGFISTDSPETH